MSEDQQDRAVTDDMLEAAWDALATRYRVEVDLPQLDDAALRAAIAAALMERDRRHQR